MSKYEIIGKDVWGIKARNLMNVTNCSECRYNGYPCSEVDCGEFFYLKDEEVEKVENKKNYKVIEKNEYGIRVRNYSEISDCNLCKNHAEKNTCNRYECAPNSYYLPDSEVEKLEYENALKTKNEELIKFLEENIEKSKMNLAETLEVGKAIAYKNVLEFIKNQNK